MEGRWILGPVLVGQEPGERRKDKCKEERWMCRRRVEEEEEVEGGGF